MILREVIIFALAVVLFAVGVAGYLQAAHGEAPLKEILSTAFAAVIGLYVGRFVERRVING